MVDYVNQKLKAWIMRKYKRFRLHKTGASLFLRRLARTNAELFVHWQLFWAERRRSPDGSGVNREVHAPFCLGCALQAR
ncbi:hypothetical protein QA640_37675 [Bradyrhizobium sp. CB82]|nr:hypothetical protein [Bradyrhizobium sp. CB82]WFU45252.1 hypothetical protein QA640_37675 [Bradyrhizobium sp. CB82]